MAKERKDGEGGKSPEGRLRKPTLAQALKVTATLAALGASLGVNVETLFAAGAADVKGPAGLEATGIGDGRTAPADALQKKIVPGARQEKFVPGSDYGKQPVVPGAVQNKKSGPSPASRVNKIEASGAVPGKIESPAAVQNKAKPPAAIPNKAKPSEAVQYKEQAPGATQIKIDGDGRAPGARQHKIDSQVGKVTDQAGAVQQKAAGPSR